MKILAIIPARAGSKGIPNKNIRLINSKPLIYYSIKNALTSKYITDVIVSTDSDIVKIIAKQLGATIVSRSKELCGDDITLDSVIYDAIPKSEDWDYIITMQPTSPTLKVETLDSAIEYAINKDLDTLISVINKPHLSWRDENGVKMPNYKERLNRQYLPPCYMETGAFVISKRDIVTEKTRIGKKVDVYEISEEESQDIDTFSDLKSVEMTLSGKKVAIYVNGNNKIGLGHVYRSLELADEFYSKPDIIYDYNITNKSIFGSTTHNLIGVNGVEELFKLVREKKYDIFINDILDTSINYMNELKSASPNSKIINFEDTGNGILKADLVFNALYNEDINMKNVKYGENYYIANKAFMLYDPISIKNQVNNVFICFGGADPQNYTDRLLNIIRKKEYEKYNFIIILGKSKKNAEELLEYNKIGNIEMLYDVNNMPELMSKCDIAITSRGRTGYELALLGIPTISIAQNEREEKHSFMCEENGFDYLGMNPSDDIIEEHLRLYLNMNKNSRKYYQDLLLKHDLKNGRKRVINLINSL